jgi:hypothetical protein
VDWGGDEVGAAMTEVPSKERDLLEQVAEMNTRFNAWNVLSDREVAILLAGQIEDQLARLIAASTRPNASARSLCEEQVSRHLTVAHAFGLIDDDEHQELRTIFKIRNKFAHTISIHSFDDVKALIGQLSIPKQFKSYGTMSSRMAFQITCVFRTHALVAKTFAAKQPEP